MNWGFKYSGLTFVFKGLKVGLFVALHLQKSYITMDNTAKMLLILLWNPEEKITTADILKDTKQTYSRDVFTRPLIYPNILSLVDNL